MFAQSVASSPYSYSDNSFSGVKTPVFPVSGTNHNDNYTQPSVWSGTNGQDASKIRRRNTRRIIYFAVGLLVLAAIAAGITIPLFQQREPITTRVSVTSTSTAVTSTSTAVTSTHTSAAGTGSGGSGGESDGGGSSGADDGSGPDADATEFVQETNKYRQEYGAQPVTWNSTLATAAQSWADKCVFQHSGGKLGPYGENLAAGSSSTYSPTNAVESWGNEASEYNWNSPGFSESTGHFTQLVWKGTREIGCAVKVCSTFVNAFNGGTNIYPAGNSGAYAQNVGTKVS